MSAGDCGETVCVGICWETFAIAFPPVGMWSVGSRNTHKSNGVVNKIATPTSIYGLVGTCSPYLNSTFLTTRSYIKVGVVM